jgi:hypothetical protein
MFGVTIFENFFGGHLDHAFSFSKFFDTNNLEIFLEKLVLLAKFSLIKFFNSKNVPKKIGPKNANFFLL